MDREGEGKRERGSCDRVLARCSTTLQSEEAIVGVSKWFEEGDISSEWCDGKSSIFLRGTSKYKKNTLDREGLPIKPWYIFMVPVNCLYKCFLIQQSKLNTTTNNNNSSKNKKKKKQKRMFSHSLSHTFPANFILPYDEIRCGLDSGICNASWIVLGSTIYFFGVAYETERTNEIYYLERNIVNTTFPSSLHFGKAGCMISERRAPKVVALDGKVYVFGDNKDVWGEVFEPDPYRFDGHSRPITSPIPSSCDSDILFVVAIEKEKSIIVGVNYKNVDGELVKLLSPDVEPTTRTAVFVYDVVEDSWIKHDPNFLINRGPLFLPIAVGSCLYWLDTKMRAYDLNTRTFYQGPIEDFVLETPEVENLKVSLLHFVGDFFCMTWVDNHDSKVLHATTIHVLKTTTKLQANCFKLRCRVFSCQNFASSKSLLLQDSALIL